MSTLPFADFRAWRLRTLLRIWLWSRGQALSALSELHASEYRDARIAWNHGARFVGPLEDRLAWNTTALVHDLALLDAADSLLGKHP